MSQLLLTKEQRYLAGSEPALQPVLRKGYLLNNFVMREYISQRVGRREKKRKRTYNLTWMKQDAEVMFV